MKLKIKQLTRALGLEVKRFNPEFSDRCVTVRPPAGPSRGNVLIAYILEPFLVAPGSSISLSHTHHGESMLMAQAFLDRGYTVDAIDFRNGEFVPRKRYDLFVSARTNLEHISARLNADCLKIAHLDTSHFAFNNAASYSRLVAQQRRRGFGVPASMRLIEHNHAIEVADFAAVLGNAVTQETYRYAGKPMFELPVPASLDFPWNAEKDFSACGKRFLWFGSGSLLHKGLDLTLEAFAGMPDMHLSVCGPLAAELDFGRAYQQELYNSPNIHAPGWVDVAGEDFRAIVGRCAAVVYPSCAEGQAGSVINAMRAGLIPVVTRETGIDVADFGILIDEPSVDGVRAAVRRLADLPASRLKEMAENAWRYAQERHGPQAYTRAYGAMLDHVISIRGSNG